jgi:ATP-dependent helicase/nuclease subunit B
VAAPRTLQLVLGPPGSGKTTHVLDAVAAELAATPAAAQLAAPPLLVLVPEQQTLTIEYELLSRLGRAAGAGRAVTSRLKVLGFAQLALWLAAGAGAVRPRLDQLGCRLLAWQLLPPGPRRSAQAEELERLVMALARQGTTPADLEACAAQLEGDAAQLAVRLRGVAGDWAQFRRLLDERGLQFDAPGTQVAQLLAARPLPGGTQLYLDGFAGFTGAEQLALEALLGQPGLQQATATLLLDPRRLAGCFETDTYDCYAVSRRLWRQLSGLAVRCGRELTVRQLSAPRRWPAGSVLDNLARQGFGRPAEGTAAASGGTVQFIECSDLRTEVDYAAREIVRLTRPAATGGGGLRCGEISVVTRSLEGYADLFRTRLDDYGVPCFIDRRPSAMHHPATELVRSGLRLALSGACGVPLADVEDAYALLKCGLLGPPGDTDDAPASAAELPLWQLENRAREVGLRLDEWLEDQPWRRPYRLEDETRAADEAAGAAAAQNLEPTRRSVLAPVYGLAGSIRARLGNLTVAELLALAWDGLLSGPVQHRLAGAELAEQAGTAAEVLQALAAMFEQLGLAAGALRLSPGTRAAAGRITAEELSTLLDYGLSGLSLGLIPPSQDSVLITEIERGRHHAVRATFVLGLTQDCWPRAVTSAQSFTAGELDAVAAATPDGRSLLGQSASEQCEREPYLALVALTRPSERLYASYPALDAQGQPLAPSPFYTSLRRLAGPHARCLQVSRATLLGSIDQAASLEDLQLALSFSGQTDLVQALPTADGTERAWRWAQRQLAQRNCWPVVPAAVAAFRTARSPLSTSPSRLEAFARCPFQHFARYGLKLRERPEDVFGPQHIGSFYHGLLDRFVQQLNAAGFDWATADAEELAAVRGQVIQEWQPRLAAFTGRRRSHYLAERAGALLGGTAAWVRPGREDPGAARPVRTELVFGSERGAELPALRLATSRGELLIGGRIDRLDIASDGKAWIVDYKLGPRSFSLRRFLAGADLQLPLYLLALEGRVLSVDGREHRLHPWQAVLQGIEPAVHDGELDFAAQAVIRPAGSLKAEVRSSLEDGRLRAWMLEGARSIATRLGEALLSGEVSPLPLRDGHWTACSGCPFRSVCRFDPLAGDQYRDLPATDTKALQEELAAGATPPYPDLPGQSAAREAGP